MATDRLYQGDFYLKNAQGTVLSVDCGEKGNRVILDRTIFFPTGGGQSCDKGLLRAGDHIWPVEEVYEEAGEVVHVLAGTAHGLASGMTVEMEINWTRRFDNMQRHCGEHILSGCFYRLFGGHNKGFHMGEDYITIDIAFDEGSKYDRITWKMAMEAERDANRVITADVPVQVDYFAARADAEKYPLRKPLAFDEDISVVTVGNPSAPEDCVACCGTHPARTGEIGLLKIYKIEPNKGMSRIYFEAGGRAMADYRELFDTLYELATRLSAGTEDVLRKFEAYEQRAEKAHAELTALRTRLLETEAERLAAGMRPGLVARYEDLSVDDLFNLGKKLAGRITGVIALVCTPANTAVLVSDASRKGGKAAAGEAGEAGKAAEGKAAERADTVNCGALVKEHAPAFGGKGGGRPDSARAFFPDGESLDRFLAEVFDESGK